VIRGEETPDGSAAIRHPQRRRPALARRHPQLSSSAVRGWPGSSAAPTSVAHPKPPVPQLLVRRRRPSWLMSASLPDLMIGYERRPGTPHFPPTARVRLGPTPSPPYSRLRRLPSPAGLVGVLRHMLGVAPTEGQNRRRSGSS
jgi:hypothetical protein